MCKLRNTAKNLLLSLALLQAGCTWVPLSDDGASVRIIANAEVSECKRLGRTKARVPRRLWIVPRPDQTVSTELEALARNEGAKLGGNAVTQIGHERDGNRTYGVYVCGD